MKKLIKLKLKKTPEATEIDFEFESTGNSWKGSVLVLIELMMSLL